MMLLENRLLGNVRIFLEIRFQNVEVGFGRRRDYYPSRVLSIVTFRDCASLAARSPLLLLQQRVGNLGRGFAHLVEFFFRLIFDL